MQLDHRRLSRRQVLLGAFGLSLGTAAPLLSACGPDNGAPTDAPTAPASGTQQPSALPAAPASPTAPLGPPAATLRATATPTSSLSLPSFALYRSDARRSGSVDLPGRRSQPAVAWEREIGPSSPPLAAGSELLIATAAGDLLMLDAASGESRRELPLGGSAIAAPTLADGRLFVGVNDVGLLALDADTGTELWLTPGQGIIWGSPLVDDSTVYFGDETRFAALDVATGDERFSIPADGRIYSPAAAYEGLVYVPLGTRLLALDAESGEVAWERAAPLDWNRLAVDADVVYCGAEDGICYALDRLSGTERWRSAQAGNFWTAPAVTEQLVVIGNVDGRIFAFDRASGAERWSFTAEDWATADPVICGGVIYAGVGNHEGRAGAQPLYALDLASGELLWSFTTDGLIHAGVAVDAERIYVVTTTGLLYALE